MSFKERVRSAASSARDRISSDDPPKIVSRSKQQRAKALAEAKRKERVAESQRERAKKLARGKSEEYRERIDDAKEKTSKGLAQALLALGEGDSRQIKDAGRDEGMWARAAGFGDARAPVDVELDTNPNPRGMEALVTAGYGGMHRDPVLDEPEDTMEDLILGGEDGPNLEESLFGMGEERDDDRDPLEFDDPFGLTGGEE